MHSVYTSASRRKRRRGREQEEKEEEEEAQEQRRSRMTRKAGSRPHPRPGRREHRERADGGIQKNLSDLGEAVVIGQCMMEATTSPPSTSSSYSGTQGVYEAIAASE